MVDIKELLLKSCDIMYEKSKLCSRDQIDDESCDWYHSAWQYLRLLDCVSAPQWHREFYTAAFKECAPQRVLISGTADYSMLHILISCLERKKNIVIDIVDKCGTPLSICEWYCNENNIPYNKPSENGICVYGHACDVSLYHSDYVKYNVICTDAFLTRFSRSEAQSILDKWDTLLHPKGKIITTVRIHSDEKASDSRSFAIKQKEIGDFCQKVIHRYRELPKKPKIGEEELQFLALQYIVFMQSHSLGNKSDIEEMFNKAGFNIHKEIGGEETTPGEIAETRYYRIVAAKSSGGRKK